MGIVRECQVKWQRNAYRYACYAKKVIFRTIDFLERYSKSTFPEVFDKALRIVLDKIVTLFKSL